MPLYEFECPVCGVKKDAVIPVLNYGPNRFPSCCGGKMRRKYSVAGGIVTQTDAECGFPTDAEERQFDIEAHARRKKILEGADNG